MKKHNPDLMQQQELVDEENKVTEKVEFNKPFSEEVYEHRPELFILKSPAEEQEEEFYKEYKENDYINDEERTKNVYGTDRRTLKLRTIKKIWKSFKETELEEFINSNTLVRVQDIYDIGIDKFLYTLGILKETDVNAWRKFKVRIKVCPECKNEFIPAMMQKNGSLCKSCVKMFSFEALGKFLKAEQEKSSKKYKGMEFSAIANTMMDVMILFQEDDDFRGLFKKDTNFVKKILGDENE